MRIKLDENVPSTIVEPLRSLGHEVDTVADEGLVGRADPDVWAAAQRDQRFLITQDLDFSDVRVFPPGSHHGILADTAGCTRPTSARKLPARALHRGGSAPVDSMPRGGDGLQVEGAAAAVGFVRHDRTGPPGHSRRCRAPAPPCGAWWPRRSRRPSVGAALRSSAPPVGIMGRTAHVVFDWDAYLNRANV